MNILTLNFVKKCGIETRNGTCETTHYESVCEKLQQCKLCSYKNGKEAHICGDQDKWCNNCRKGVKFSHRCHILTEDERLNLYKRIPTPKFSGYVFFDFETFEDSVSGNHIVNLAMAYRICVACLNIINPDERCKSRILQVVS